MLDAIKKDFKNKDDITGYLERPTDSLFWILEEPHHLTYLGQRKYYSLYLAASLLRPQHKALVKFIQPHWLNYHRIRQKFMDESQLLRSLHGPGFPQWITSGRFHEQPYFCYAWPEGKLLSSHLTERDLFPLSTLRSVGLFIVAQLLQRLVYLHERINPLAHGEINVDNILLDTQQKVHIVDFSCSYFIHTRMQKNIHWTGASAYLSPEQAQGKPWECPSDIYQLGILCYEWFTGQRWNRGKTTQERKRFAASAHLPRADFLVSQGLSPSLSALVAAMLNPVAEKRPSAIWLQQQLKDY